ncbi:MAG: ABC transporter ATP-binding protein/permease [Pseudomonadota bacterium]
MSFVQFEASHTTLSLKAAINQSILMKHSRYTDTSTYQFRWSIVADLWTYLAPYKTRIIVALSCLIFSKLASVSLPLVLKQIVDQLEDPTTFIILPIALLVAYGALRFANVIFNELRDTLFGRVTESAMRAMSVKALKHLHRLDISYHMDRQMGGVARDIERGVSGFSFLLRFMVFNIVPTLLEVGMVIAILLWNYPVWFAVLVFFSVVTYVSFSVYTTEWRTQFIRELNETDSGGQSKAIDSLLNYETVRYFSNEKWEVNQYDQSLEAWQAAKRKNRLSLFLLNSGQALIIALSMTAMLTLAAYEVTKGTMSLGDFVLVNAFMMQLFIPLNFLGFVYREMKSSLVNIEKILELFTLQPKVFDSDNAITLSDSKHRFEFINVDFAYNSRQTLHQVSFTIPESARVAIVGKSGSGKSTIVKLLFRFYDVQNGSIHVDDTDIKNIKLASLRKCVSIVPQEPVLFNTSIKENIRYGNLTANDEMINKAIDSAHLREFVQSLPDKEDTLVGERGLKVSGGEKQRIAIARALIRKPSLIVFDEATSSLDSVSENAINNAVQEISRSISTLVIAHRLSTVVDADTIVVLKEGQVVEMGGHTQLLKNEGEYAKLWSSQME